MTPTFRAGQLLFVRPLAGIAVVGDVIVFSDPPRARNVVHRLVAVDGKRFVMRGDNNTRSDALSVLVEQVIGKVEWVDADSVVHPVLGGWRGMWKARLHWVMRWFDQLFRHILGSPYRAFRRSGLIACFWKPTIIKLFLQNKNGLLIKYIYKQRSVAVWFPSQKLFLYRNPYDLVISPPEVLKKHANLG